MKEKNKLIIIAVCLSTIILFNNNFFMYKTPIMKVSRVTNIVNKKSEKIIQNIEGIIKNGPHKGEEYSFKYESSKSLVEDLRIKKNSKIFVNIKDSKYVNIIEVKRDGQIVMLLTLTIGLIILIAGKQGIKSLFGAIINILLMITIIYFYINHENSNLLLLFIPITFLLITFSLTVSNGFNKKSKCAILGSILSLTCSFIISYIILNHYEDTINFYTLDFIDITKEYKNIYYVIILLSGLGAIMDISITMASSIYEIINNKPQISFKNLKQSALNISKDISGTMINVLLLTSIISVLPTIIFLFKNNMNIMNALNIYGQTQIILILTSSIGIVLAIPICMHLTLYIFRGRIK